MGHAADDLGFLLLIFNVCYQTTVVQLLEPSQPKSRVS